MILRHHWRQGEIWGGNSSFLSHRICTVQWSSHLICWRLMSCSHQELGELELQLCHWWDWGGEEAFGGLGTANLSSQIGYLQTMHSQEQLRVPQLGWHQYLHTYSTAWKPLFIPVDSSGSLRSEFKHYIHSLKLNCEKPSSSLWTMPHHVTKSVLLTPGTCRYQALWDTAFSSAWLGEQGLCRMSSHVWVCTHLFVRSYLLCMWKPEPLHGHTGTTSDVW